MLAVVVLVFLGFFLLINEIHINSPRKFPPILVFNILYSLITIYKCYYFGARDQHINGGHYFSIQESVARQDGLVGNSSTVISPC